MQANSVSKGKHHINAFLKLDAILELPLAIHRRVLTKPQNIPQWLAIFKQKK